MSTVPPGTTQRLGEIIRELNPEANFDMVCNPEFQRTGVAINDFMSPPSIILGLESQQAKELFFRLYRPIANKRKTKDHFEIMTSDFKTAELIKYGSNCFAGLKISYVNELATLCESIGVDISTLIKGIYKFQADLSLSNQLPYPGPGFGGSCLPKDTVTLKQIFINEGLPIHTIDAAILVNRKQPKRIVNMINDRLGDLSNMTIAVLGLSFKPNTNEVRLSPALAIIEKLVQRKANIRAHDPVAIEAVRPKLLDDVKFCSNAYEAMEMADAAIFIVPWDQYQKLDPKRMRKAMCGRIIFDLQRCLSSQEEMVREGFEYVGLGQGTQKSAGCTKPPVSPQLTSKQEK